MPKWMMIPCLPPVPHPVLQIRNDLREVWMLPSFRSVILIETEKEELRCSWVNTW